MWQPIETAPRDGTHILAYPVLLDVACVVSWGGIGHAGYWRLPMTDRVAPYHPTHWMSVPKPDISHPKPLRGDITERAGRRDIFSKPQKT